MKNPRMQGKWTVRLVTALLWVLAAVSVVYWGLRLSGRGAAPQAPPALAQAPAGNPASLARLLGAQPSAPAAPAPAAANRFVLSGVIATSESGGGAVLLSVDGQPPRPLVVGTEIAPGFVLQEVSRREAIVSDGAQVRIVLKLPAESEARAAAPPSLPGAPAAVQRAPAAALPPAPAPAGVVAPPSGGPPAAAPNGARPSLRGDPRLSPVEAPPAAGRSLP